jgi:hypothetical protein
VMNFKEDCTSIWEMIHGSKPEEQNRKLYILL